jgi:alkylhydroperoxidase family enzyme
VLADWLSAPVPERLRAALGFLRALTLEPDTVGPADVAALLAAGLSRAEIEDAAAVCAVFNVIDRIADALGFHVPSAESLAARAERMLASSYLLPDAADAAAGPRPAA